MRIVIFSDWETTGGAAVATSRLAAALVKAGHDVTRIVQHRGSGLHPWRTRRLPGNFLRRLISCGLSLPVANRVSTALVGRGVGAVLRRLRPDAINFHNIHGAYDWGWSSDMLAVCRRFAPVTWTLHDAWSFTGRCGYFHACGKYLSGCDASCPTPREYPALPPAWIDREWRRKHDLFRRIPDLAAISPSRWLARAAEEGLWRGHRVHVVPSGLDLTTFAPLARPAARAALKLAPQARVLLLSAWHLGDARKGGPLLAEALRRVAYRPLCLLTMGGGELAGVPGDVRTVALGFIADERQKALAYNAADLFVHPSLADNLPNTVLEAMACGTPTAAFAVGGLPELVRPAETGWLAGQTSASALAAAIDQALAEIDADQTLRESCRRVAEAEYDERLQVRRYESLWV